MGTTTGHHLASSLLICAICATIYLGTDFTTAIAKKTIIEYNKETLWVNCTSESDEEKQLSYQCKSFTTRKISVIIV